MCTDLFLNNIWFFAITCVSVIFLFWFVEKEATIGSAIWVVLYLLYVQLIVKINVVSYLIKYPSKSIGYLAIYFIIGFLWSFVKWWLFVHKKAIKYKEARYAFLKLQKEEHEKKNEYLSELMDIKLNTPVPDFLEEKWKNQWGVDHNLPEVHNNKNKIVHWVMYWPVSMVWSVINDFVKKVIKVITIKIQIIYNSITISAYGCRSRKK